MDAKTQARLATRAKVFKALAHPSRLLVVEQLAHKERCVCELRDMIGADISTVSKHLSVLKGAGIIQDEKRGLQVYYRLKMSCVLRFFDCVGEVIETNAKEQWDIVNPVTSERIAAVAEPPLEDDARRPGDVRDRS